MNVNDVAGADELTRGWAFQLDNVVLFDQVVEGIFGEAAQGELGFIGVAVVEHCGHEVPGVAVVTLDKHCPDISLAGEDLDIFAVEFAVADDTAVHSSEYDVFNLSF